MADPERDRVLGRLLRKEKLLTLLFRRAFADGGDALEDGGGNDDASMDEDEAAAARDDYLEDLAKAGIVFDDDAPDDDVMYS